MSLTAKLAHALAMEGGINHRDLIPVALAASIAIEHGIRGATPRSILSELASRLAPRNEADALVRVRDWLHDLELSDQQLRPLVSFLPGPIDWTAELEALVDQARYRAPFIPISPRIGAAIGDALDLPAAESVACLYSGSATIAWGLARSRAVTLHVTQWEVEVVMALLAFADGRPLHVDRRNPIETIPVSDGGFSFGEKHSPYTGEYDHLIAVPPIGYRIRQGDGAGMLFEAWQLEQLAPRANKSFFSLATDGLLFRENRGEAEFRERLCATGGLSVISLPPGIFGRASGVQVNLLQLQRDGSLDIAFVDGRSMERVSRSGREQEDLIVRQLGKLGDAPMRQTSRKEVAESGFSLLPSRYIVSDDLARMDKALAGRPTVRLGDIARIIRPRAPQPARGDATDDDVTAMEIAVADIVDGKVEYPSKEVRFPPREQSGISRAQVSSGDILISIKGNVGAVGIVGESADWDDMRGIPQIISQSLAIVRPMLSGPIRRHRVLAGILASPQMRAKLQAMAAGTTVPTLPISALQDLALPLPDDEEADDIERHLEELESMQADIDALIANRRILQDALWLKFWNMPSDEDA